MQRLARRLVGEWSLQFFAVSKYTCSVIFAPGLPATVWEKMSGRNRANGWKP